MLIRHSANCQGSACEVHQPSHRLPHALACRIIGDVEERERELRERVLSHDTTTS